MQTNNSKTYVFIDSSNLTYGGSRLLGWKIDFGKLLNYLHDKYNGHKVCFYAGIFTDEFKYRNHSEADFPIEQLIEFLKKRIEKDADKDLRKCYIQAKFLLKLKELGYQLKLKPIKTIKTKGGRKMKANCDLEICFDVMREFRQFDRLVLISGDGDFEILLKYCLEKQKSIIILSNPKNTAIKIKKEFKDNYRSIQEIKQRIERK